MTCAAPTTVSVHVPFRIRRRGGRRLMIAPDGTETVPRPRVDSTLVKALARAHRWKRMLEDGDYASSADLAREEKIAKSYLSCVLRLTLLAPDIVEAILDGRQPERVTFDLMRKPFPLEWEAQRRHFMAL